MPLVMKTYSKGVARFEWSDDEAETLITVESTDPEQVIIRKLKRVIALAEGGQPLPQRVPGQALAAAQEAFPAPEPVTGNGWATYRPTALPEVPARLQGEVELIPPGEQS